MRRRLSIMLMLLIAGGVARAETAPDVRTAVDRAVAGLRKVQLGDGSWGTHGPGTTSLAMLAMLEGGVKPDDPAMVKAARFIRYESLRSTHTYSVALSVLALDRLGVKDDVPLIKVLTQRLVNGQQRDAGWTYRVPLGDIGELEGKFPSPGSSDGGPRNDFGGEGVHASDNSNTPFAVLALWVGRKSGVNVREALRRTQVSYRLTASMYPNGAAWGYNATSATPNGARACAGLLGLAVHMGLEAERRLTAGGGDSKTKPKERHNPFADPLVYAAFRYATAEFVVEVSKPPAPQPRIDYYFLWSYERAAVAYGVKSAFGVNWHRLGVRRLLPFQGANGLWTGNHGEVADTSFAVLFLMRANLALDLSTLLAPGQSVELKIEDAPPPEPPAAVPTVDSLIKKFLDVNPEARSKLIDEYRDQKGVVYTDALAKLIPRSDGEWPKKLRDALATRLSRMTADTLRERLKDTDHELRRAAAVACAMKDDKSLTGDLIAALDDKEPWVVRACGVALARLTGQNFGPEVNATPDERAKAVAAWKAWWKKHQATKDK